MKMARGDKKAGLAIVDAATEEMQEIAQPSAPAAGSDDDAEPTLTLRAGSDDNFRMLLALYPRFVKHEEVRRWELWREQHPTR
jgi:hypothetical protein